jgi:hypothetical protein
VTELKAAFTITKPNCKVVFFHGLAIKDLSLIFALQYDDVLGYSIMSSNIILEKP